MSGTATIVGSDDLAELGDRHLTFAYLEERTYHRTYHIP